MTHERRPISMVISAIVTAGVVYTSSPCHSASPQNSDIMIRANAAILRARVPALLDRLGFSAEALAASGFQAADVSAVAARVRSHCDDTFFSDLRAADLLCRQAEDARNRAADHVRGGGGADAVSELATREAALTAAQTARDQLLSSAWTAAADGLSPGSLALLMTIRENRDRGVPVEYRLRVRQEAEWLMLREALSNGQLSGPGAASLIDLLARTDLEPEVVAAKQHLRDRLTAIRAAISTP